MAYPPIERTGRTVVEFFAGIGLMRMGLERAGWSVVLANDIDPAKEEMYAHQFPDATLHFKLGDIHDLDPQEIPTVSLATASFPCTDLSLAGAREGLDGKNSSAFWGFINIIRGMRERRPPLILLENVTGFLSSNDGDDFEKAMLALNGLGYTVDPFIVDAAHFVPQSRKRLFVVAIDKSLAGPTMVSERFFQSALRPPALAAFVFEHPEIDWALRELPNLPVCRASLEMVLDELPNNSPEWYARERVIPFGIKRSSKGGGVG